MYLDGLAGPDYETADCGCRPKCVSAGFGCGLGCTLALSVSHSVPAAAVCGFCCCRSVFDFLPVNQQMLMLYISFTAWGIIH